MKSKWKVGDWSPGNLCVIEWTALPEPPFFAAEYRKVAEVYNQADVPIIAAAPEMYEVLKMVCEDCEKLSNWEDMFNIGRPEGSIMPKCPCDECYVKEALLKANGEAFLELKKRKRLSDIAQDMYDKLVELKKVLRPTVPVLANDIKKVLEKVRGGEC